jgi:hypothetical protein
MTFFEKHFTMKNDISDFDNSSENDLFDVNDLSNENCKIILNTIINCLNIILVLASLISMFTIFFNSIMILKVLVLKISMILRSKQSLDSIDQSMHLASRARHIASSEHLMRLSVFAFHLVEQILILIEKFFVHSYDQFQMTYSKNELIL